MLVVSQCCSYDVKREKRGGEERGMKGYPGRIFRFYRDGFRSMTIGKSLWRIILVKLFIMFAVLKVFFFPDFLSTQFQYGSTTGRLCDGADYTAGSKTELREE